MHCLFGLIGPQLRLGRDVLQGLDAHAALWELHRVQEVWGCQPRPGGGRKGGLREKGGGSGKGTRGGGGGEDGEVVTVVDLVLDLERTSCNTSVSDSFLS